VLNWIGLRHKNTSLLEPRLASEANDNLHGIGDRFVAPD
jgi:hypothetical protein